MVIYINEEEHKKSNIQHNEISENIFFEKKNFSYKNLPIKFYKFYYDYYFLTKNNNNNNNKNNN